MTDRRTALYRYFDADGRLLYVGIAIHPIARQSQHASASAWYQDAATSCIEWFATRREALDAERRAILVENPLHNIKRPIIGPRVSKSSGKRYVDDLSVSPTKVVIRTPLSLQARRLYELLCARWWVDGQQNWAFVSEAEAMSWMEQLGATASRKHLLHLLEELFSAEAAFCGVKTRLLRSFRAQRIDGSSWVGVSWDDEICKQMTAAWTPKMSFAGVDK